MATETKVGIFAAAGVVKGKVFNLRTRIKLGITHDAVKASVLRMEEAGEFADWTKENVSECLEARGQLLALAVMEDIRTQNAPAWCEEYEAGAVDWEAVLAFVTQLLQIIMPFIIKSRAKLLAA